MTALDVLSPAENSVTFPAGSIIFHEGEPGEAMYVILEGIVQILVGGRRIATASPGGIIGEMAMISRQPRSATAIAETHCTLVPIDEQQFQLLKQQLPALMVEVLSGLSERLHRTTIREADRYQPVTVHIRLALADDLPAIQHVVAQSIRVLGAGDYTQQQIESALHYAAGVDTPDLIVDGTYYVAEVQGQVVGCGGWSRRNALHSGGPMASADAQQMLDPARDAAKIRQFYVHPRWAKRGIARRLLHTCEEAAQAAGFVRLELAATLTGEPLYAAYGFKRTGQMQISLPDGISLNVIKMTKQIVQRAVER